MKKLLHNLGICFLSCFMIVACSEDDEKDTQNNKPEPTKDIVIKEKKSFLKFTPTDKINKNKGTSLSDLLNFGGDKVGSVNKYLWQASIEVLNFLPIRLADPFSGIISFDKGRPPGSSKIYDATVYISDAALSAESLNVSVRNSDGSISFGAEQEIENAILSRARKLRINSLDK